MIYKTFHPLKADNYWDIDGTWHIKYSEGSTHQTNQVSKPWTSINIVYVDVRCQQLLPSAVWSLFHSPKRIPFRLGFGGNRFLQQESHKPWWHPKICHVLCSILPIRINFSRDMSGDWTQLFWWVSPYMYVCCQFTGHLNNHLYLLSNNSHLQWTHGYSTLILLYAFYL